MVFNISTLTLCHTFEIISNKIIFNITFIQFPNLLWNKRLFSCFVRLYFYIRVYNVVLSKTSSFGITFISIFLNQVLQTIISKTVLISRTCLPSVLQMNTVISIHFFPTCPLRSPTMITMHALFTYTSN